jgi:hypothetical protein
MPDTDGGSVKDGDEDKDHDGVKDELETDPTAGNGADDLENDFDGDGIPNEDELILGTDPLDADSDDDGVKDGAEPSFDEDTDGDGTINALDPDSDNDGLKDGTELGLGCDDEDTDASAGNCVADADDGATKTNPLDADTDDGSVSDGDEDTNKNGAVDDGERDPNVASDDVPSTGCTTDADCGDAASGRVCDTESGACIDGCRGEDGNGCPSDESCSSDDATVGTCEPTSAQAPEFSAEGNGIFCSYAPSNDGETSFGVFALLAALGLIGQRRSRRRAA